MVVIFSDDWVWDREMWKKLNFLPVRYCRDLLEKRCESPAIIDNNQFQLERRELLETDKRVA